MEHCHQFCSLCSVTDAASVSDECYAGAVCIKHELTLDLEEGEWCCLAFVAFYSSHYSIFSSNGSGKTSRGYIRGVCAAASASVGPTREARSFVNESKKWMESSHPQREWRQKRKLHLVTEYKCTCWKQLCLRLLCCHPSSACPYNDNLFSLFKYMSYLWHRMPLFFLLQRNSAFITTIWGSCIQPSFYSYTCSDFAVAERKDKALFSFWKPQEMDLNSILSWGPHSKSYFSPYILQHMMDVTSKRHMWPHNKYILCPLLCQSNAPMWGTLEPNVQKTGMFGFLSRFWLQFKLNCIARVRKMDGRKFSYIKATVIILATLTPLAGAQCVPCPA